MTPWTAACQVSLSITNTWSLLKLLSRWCHPTISSSAIPFSSCFQPFPVSGSFPMSQFFALGGQSIGASTSVSVLNDYSGLISFRMDWFDLLAVQGTLIWILLIDPHIFLHLPHTHMRPASILHTFASLWATRESGLPSSHHDLFKSYVWNCFCFISCILLVFSHWAILIPALVIIRDLSQVYLKLEAPHS